MDYDDDEEALEVHCARMWQRICASPFGDRVIPQILARMRVYLLV